jgi:hypothetical protein
VVERRAERKHAGAADAPYVGFRPTVPHHDEGMRMEPPVSVPRAAKQSPAATATPEPLDEPPVLLPAFQGLMGMGRVGW